MIHGPSQVNISIVGIDTENVGKPRGDGTAGSGLYKVPIKLSEAPGSRWGQLFVSNWDRPPEYSTMHRPGIARVSGDTIILDGTTVEEVRDTHVKTLKLAVAATNEQATALMERERAEYEARQRQDAEHEAHVNEVADEVEF